MNRDGRPSWRFQVDQGYQVQQQERGLDRVALKFKAIADERGYDEILEGTVNIPRDTDVSGGEASAQVKAANKRGYRDLILATKDTSLTMVANAKTDALPKGDLHLAWKKLEKRWDLKSREDKIDSLTKFIQLKMENIQMKPQDWMAHMEKKRNELENAGHEWMIKHS